MKYQPCLFDFPWNLKNRIGWDSNIKLLDKCINTSDKNIDDCYKILKKYEQCVNVVYIL